MQKRRNIFGAMLAITVHTQHVRIVSTGEMGDTTFYCSSLAEPLLMANQTDTLRKLALINFLSAFRAIINDTNITSGKPLQRTFNDS